MTTETRMRRNYTEEFKRDAVALVEEAGKDTGQGSRQAASLWPVGRECAFEWKQANLRVG
jgi:transposase-like protein